MKVVCREEGRDVGTMATPSNGVVPQEEAGLLQTTVPGRTQREGHRAWVGIDSEARKNPAEGRLFSLVVIVESLWLVC